MVTKPEQHIVTVSKFEELSAAYCGDTIGNSGAKAKYITYKREDYIITNGQHGPDGNFWEGYHAVPESVYLGQLKALWPPDHWRAVDNGERERCYTGMRVMIAGIKWVMYGDPVRFLQGANDEQKTLF